MKALDHVAEEADEEHNIEDPPANGFWKVASLGFGVILIAEWGDLTQTLTATLAANRLRQDLWHTPTIGPY